MGISPCTHAFDPSTWEVQASGFEFEFEATLGYMVSFSLAQATIEFTRSSFSRAEPEIPTHFNMGPKSWSSSFH